MQPKFKVGETVCIVYKDNIRPHEGLNLYGIHAKILKREITADTPLYLVEYEIDRTHWFAEYWLEKLPQPEITVVEETELTRWIDGTI